MACTAPGKEGSMENLLIIGGVIVAWVVITRFILPKLGIQG